MNCYPLNSEVRRLRLRWNRPLLVCLIAVLARGMLVSTAAAQADSAMAQHEGSSWALENQAVRASFHTSDHHLIGLQIRDELDHRTLALPDAFTILLDAGTTLRSSQLILTTGPSITDLPVSTNASRLAEHFAGKQICAEFVAPVTPIHVRWCALLRDGSKYMRQTTEIRALQAPLAIHEVRLLQFTDAGAVVAGSVKGSPVRDDTMYFGFEHPLSSSSVVGNQVSASITRVLPLQAGQSVTYSSVIGVSAPGQMRRSFLAYLERERAHPYRTFLHYNSWYDLGYNNRYDEAGVLSRVHAFGEKLVRQRGVVLDSLLFDDGWDNPHSLWAFHAGFPHGFTRVREAAARYHFGIGVWLSPWGGYEQAKQQRIEYGRAHRFEIVNDGFALSGPRYYKKFEQTCLEMIDRYGVNQFKFDGTGNADRVVAGSAFDSDFDAAIHLIGTLRQREPGIFINLTTGTYPSPFWLRYSDSIWRGGEDHSFDGVGTWRQKWITYRDEQTYRHIVRGGPLFPLNSLMLHGMIYAKQAEHLSDDPGHDFSDEVRSYFGTGTQLQEMYITPTLLAQQDWDLLARCARWSRANVEVLRDTHWIGGDPGALQVYGWAAWSPRKAIVTLRNPSDHAQVFRLDAATAFELPADAARHFRVTTPWPDGAQSAPATLSAGTAQLITLQPFQVMTLEAWPIR